MHSISIDSSSADRWAILSSAAPQTLVVTTKPRAVPTQDLDPVAAQDAKHKRLPTEEALRNEVPQLDWHHAAAFGSLLESFQPNVAAMTLTTASIVEYVNVIEYVSTRLIASSVDSFLESFLDSFLFQAAEARLRDCVVPTVSAATHASLEVMRDTEAIPGVAAVLRPLVRVNMNCSLGHRRRTAISNVNRPGYSGDCLV
jgi:hypothetical protein